MSSLAIAGTLFFGLGTAALPVFAHAANIINSPNWSGYAAENGSYTGASGTWVIPNVTPSQTTEMQADSTWVGIGGINRGDLIQAGTLATSQSGTIHYQAWYELLPEYPTMIPVSVKANDTIRVKIVETSPGIWQITFANLTSGETFEKTVAYASAHTSAEWIEEAPRLPSGAYVPLSNYGVVQFKDTWAIKNGVRMNPREMGARPLRMHDSARATISNPGALDTTGTAFAVARHTNTKPSSLTQASMKQSVALVSTRPPKPESYAIVSTTRFRADTTRVTASN